MSIERAALIRLDLFDCRVAFGSAEASMAAHFMHNLPAPASMQCKQPQDATRIPEEAFPSPSPAPADVAVHMINAIGNALV